MEPEILYANAVNLTGLYSPIPMIVTYDPATQLYWGDSGNFDVSKIGTTLEDGRVVFASDKQTETYAWTKGVQATMCMLRKWATAHKEGA